jgi:hypothetical protein
VLVKYPSKRPAISASGHKNFFALISLQHSLQYNFLYFTSVSFAMVHKTKKKKQTVTTKPKVCFVDLLRTFIMFFTITVNERNSTFHLASRKNICIPAPYWCFVVTFVVRVPCRTMSFCLYPTVHYRINNSPPLSPILGQLNSVHILTPYFKQPF